jgi:hypothetical protein
MDSHLIQYATERALMQQKAVKDLAAEDLFDCSEVSRRFLLIPLRNCLFTPAIPWQSRGQRRF